MKDSEKNGIPGASLAAMARTASGASWPGVLLVGVGAELLRKLPAVQTPPRWLQVLQALWSTFLLSQCLHWAVENWSGGENRVWIALILLALAWWLARKNREAVKAASSVLGLFELGLLVSVLLGSLREIRLENLLPARGLPDGWLLAVLLLPGASQTWGGLWALPFSLVTVGVGCGGQNALWQMSQSVSGFGSVKRLESLAAAGLTLGFYLISAELLSRENAGDRTWSAVLAAGLFLSGFRLNGWIAALSAAVVWCFLPALCRQKTRIKDKAHKRNA